MKKAKTVKFLEPIKKKSSRNLISEIALMVGIHQKWKLSLLDSKHDGDIIFELRRSDYSLVVYSRILHELGDQFYIERYNSTTKNWERHPHNTSKKYIEDKNIYNKYWKFRVNIEKTLKQ